MHISIRTANIDDAEKILDIYAPYVRKTAITFEYDVPKPDEFRERIRNTLKRFPFIVAENNGEIIGYAYAGCFNVRQAYRYAAETTVYVREDMKGMGTGRKLYDKLEGILKMQNFLNLYACIAYPDIEDEYLSKNSVRFHEHLGYSFVGRFLKCGYKFGRWYHMVWMEKHIGNHKTPPPEIKSFEEIREIIEK